MKIRRIDDTVLVRLDKGEEIVDAVTRACREQNIQAGVVFGIGAVSRAITGLYDTGRKEFIANTWDRPMEITALAGNISLKDGEIYQHMHITMADASGSVFGGHLKSAVVSATAEIVIRVLNGTVGREFAEDIGLNLWKF